MLAAVEPDGARRVARIFTVGYLNSLLDPKSRSVALAQLRCLVAPSAASTVGSALETLYSALLCHYRNEHVYKESLVQWWMNRSGNRASAGVVLELRAGTAKLDALCGVGTSLAFEIKTDYDQPTRLQAQLAAYYARFPRVSLVCSENRLGRYQRILPVSVGLMTISNRGVARFSRQPEINSDSLSLRAMIGLLRQDEVVQLGSRLGIRMRDVPNTRISSTLMQGISDIAPLDLSHLIARVLGRRSAGTPVSFLRALPGGLKALVVKRGLTNAEADDLVEVLSNPLARN